MVIFRLIESVPDFSMIDWWNQLLILTQIDLELFLMSSIFINNFFHPPNQYFSSCAVPCLSFIFSFLKKIFFCHALSLVDEDKEKKKMKIYVKWNAARFMQISEVKIMFQKEKFFSCCFEQKLSSLKKLSYPLSDKKGKGRKVYFLNL